MSFWNIYSTDINHDDHHDECNVFIEQATGDSKIIRMIQVVASPTIIILTTLEVSFMLLENIYSTGVNHDNHHDDCNIFIVQVIRMMPSCGISYDHHCDNSRGVILEHL